MSTPFSWFRRKQKILLAVFGVLIMFSFVVGGIVMDYLQPGRGGSGGGAEKVLTWRHGHIDEDELASMRYMHNWTVRFLDMLIGETLAAGGTPKGAGIRRNQQGQIVDPGIPRSGQEEDVVRTMVLARKAAEMGMVVTEEAIFEFLHLVSDDKIRRQEFGRILRDATSGRVARDQLFKQLETEMLAQNLQRVVGSGLMAMPPENAWDYYNRFTRKIKAEVLPLRVEDFTDKVKGAPTDEQVEQLYEEGKDRYPDPNSPEPGFKRRKEIAFAYLKIEYEKFLEEAKAEVSEEDIKKHYEENKDDFKVPDLPPAEEAKPEAKPEDAGAEGDMPSKEEPPKPPAKDEGTKPVPTAKDDASTGEESDPPADPKPVTEAAKPKEAEREASKPSAETDASSDPDVDLVPPENKTGDAKTPDTSEGTRVRRIEDTQFVSFNAAPKSKDAEVPAEVEPAEKKHADAPGESAAKEASAKEDSATEAKPPSAPKGQSDEADAVASDEDAPVGEASEKEKPVKYQPIEDVEDQIRGVIAAPIAEERKNKALEDAKREVDLYYNKRIKWLVTVDTELETAKPQSFDYEKFAEENNLTAGETPLLDEIEVGDYELGKGWLNIERGQRVTFAQIAYMDGIPLFRASQITSNEWGVDFLYWKVEEEDWKDDEGKVMDVPELKAIRAEVVEAWERGEALKLARAKAEKLAENAKGDKLLKEALNDELAKKVVETGEFSWMSYGATPMSFGLPGISSVVGMDGSGTEFKEDAPGMEFMEAVYALEPGENGVAVNQPETVVYLVRMLSEDPDEAQRKTEFLQTGSMYAMFLHMTTVREAMEDWYKDIEKEMEVEWHRSPEIFTQR